MMMSPLVASLSFPPDFDRLHWHQLAWRTIAFGDQARYAVLALAGDDPYRFRPPGGGTAPTAPGSHPTARPIGRVAQHTW